jgi:hypothetical protein
MISSFQTKITIIFLILFFVSNTPTFSSQKLVVSKVVNDIFILDVYGKRFNLKDSNTIKKGDYLKTKNSAASFVLKNKSKICLSPNASLKVTSLNLIKENHETTFELKSGYLFLSFSKNTSDIYNLNFSSYSLKKLKNDIFLSNNNGLELINYGSNLTLFFNDEVKIKVSPFNNFKLLKNGNVINTNRVLNNENIKKKFLAACVTSIPKIEYKNNANKPQYGCTTQDGKLVCGNKHKY